MFCYQCQEAAGGKGCTVNGICGKNSSTADLQDVLVFVTKGLAFWTHKGREFSCQVKEADVFILEALFTTITNVNFDPRRLSEQIKAGLKLRAKIEDNFRKAYQEKKGTAFTETVPEAAQWSATTQADFAAKAISIGILATENEDLRSIKELLIYGLKGMAAYAHHALVLGYQDDQVSPFISKALSAMINEKLGLEDFLALVLEAGEKSVMVMAILDKANTESYGVPQITEVSGSLEDAPGILVSGHDLLDLAQLLEQTQNTGIKIYTHGEMLPANGYPKLRKYPHLAGNYGTSWYNQQTEFESFQGPILFTTNCIQKPLASYADRVYTTGLVAWEGIKHIEDAQKGHPKDFSRIITKAKECGNLTVKPGKAKTIGFHHQTVLSLAGTIIEKIKAGAIKRFVVMAGCDGRHKEREYFTEVAKKLPKDSIILTAGCAKFRYNELDLGDIGGIPRLIDAGQCNDSYSLAVIALKLKEAFGMESLNDLPLSFDIGWYEQKAVCVLLALLHLGVKGIRLGPSLPAFLSPNVAKVLIDQFELKATSTAEADVELIMAGK
ncbi:MAG: hydroxylamine reductase [Spirochaetales bacterium]|nr:hydroxylamine reductase [Spirochaetales bacterium]